MPLTSTSSDCGANPSLSVTRSIPLTVPLDVLHIILDIIASQNDLSTLKSLSLLCRPLLPTVRKHLFGTIRLAFSPSTTMNHVARRISGLNAVLSRNPDLSDFIRALCITDTHPLSETDHWLTRIPSLPPFLLKLNAVRTFTFGCDVGMLDWKKLSYELKMALFHIFHTKEIESIRLAQISRMPYEDAISATRKARKLSLDRVHTIGESNVVNPPKTITRLFEIRVHSTRMMDTESAWEVIRHSPTVWRRIIWRCWEDPPDPRGFSLPGPINLSQLPRLSQLYFKISSGKLYRDFNGLVSLLNTVSHTNALKEIRISIVFPYPFDATPREWSDIVSCPAWKNLQTTLLKPEFAFLSRVILEITVNYGRRQDWRDVIDRFGSMVSQKIPELKATKRFSFQIKVDTFG